MQLLAISGFLNSNTLLHELARVGNTRLMQAAVEAARSSWQILDQRQAHDYQNGQRQRFGRVS